VSRSRIFWLSFISKLKWYNISKYIHVILIFLLFKNYIKYVSDPDEYLEIKNVIYVKFLY
jgi:hypothetical protein